MSTCKPDDVRRFILKRYADPIFTRGFTPDTVPDDYDLLNEGIIDSLGILEMISAVEKEFMLEIDYDGLDANDLTVIGPFCRYVEAQRSRRLEDV